EVGPAAQNVQRITRTPSNTHSQDGPGFKSCQLTETATVPLYGAFSRFRARASAGALSWRGPVLLPEECSAICNLVLARRSRAPGSPRSAAEGRSIPEEVYRSPVPQRYVPKALIASATVNFCS